jgi:hypothetical protein
MVTSILLQPMHRDAQELHIELSQQLMLCHQLHLMLLMVTRSVQLYVLLKELNAMYLPSKLMVLLPIVSVLSIMELVPLMVPVPVLEINLELRQDTVTSKILHLLQSLLIRYARTRILLTIYKFLVLMELIMYSLMEHNHI